MGGAILNDEETFIKAIFTPTAPYVITDILPYWGEIRIAEENQPGFNNDVLSTSKPYLTNNRIIPLDGDSFADINLVSNTIEVECRTNISQIKENVNYKLSGRLANQDEPIAPEQWVFKTIIDVPTDGAFTPNVTAIGGEVVTWTLIEGYNETINSLNKADRVGLLSNELNGTCQNVVVTFSTNDADNITEIDLQNDFICDELDLSILTSVAKVLISGNPFTSLVMPTGNLITQFNASSNVGLTTMDLSNNTFQTILIFNSCTSLTSVNFGSDANTGKLTDIRMNGCDLTGTLDFSRFTNFQTRFWCYSNPNLTAITFGVNTNTAGFSFFYVSDNDLTGTLDLSNVNIGNGSFRAQGNSNLTSILNPSNNNLFTQYKADGCNLGYIDFTTLPLMTDINGGDIELENNSMSATDVNHILVDLDSISSGGFTGRTIILNGSNAAPDGISGGYDGLTAKANLITKGFTVTTN